LATDEKGGPAFEDLVVEALDSLPEDIATRLENVEIVVEDEPPDEFLETLAAEETLFGHYHGVPITERDGNYAGVLPDKISIYRGPIVRHHQSTALMRDAVRTTLIHEIGHHFGIEEDRLHELGWG
jgi:predicted Zn-dependent protease with MMP-like domain